MTINILYGRTYGGSFTASEIQSNYGNTGNYISSENSSLLSELKPFNDLLQSFSSGSNIVKNTGIMPPGVRYVTKDFIVYERQPEYKNVFIIPKLVSEIGSESQEKQYSYSIPLPWQLYIIQYSTVINENGEEDYYPANVKLHFMKNSLTSLDQELYLAPIPNFYTDGSLCRPMFSSMEETERYSKDIAGVIHAAYDWIWNCGTNLDLTESCLQMFSQLNNVPITETIFYPIFTDIPNKVNLFSSYYVPFVSIDYLMRAWEKNSLEDVCNTTWPSNSVYRNFATERNHIMASSEFCEFLRQVEGTEPEYELHYDDDEDHEYQCEYNPEEFDVCSCHIPINCFSWINYFKYINNNNSYPKRLTFLESFSSFVKFFSPTNIKLKNTLSPWETSIALANIENKIIYSS